MLVVIFLLLDPTAAFDTIDHNILLSRLDQGGINGDALDRFRSYLSDRSFFVSFFSHLHTWSSPRIYSWSCGVTEYVEKGYGQSFAVVTSGICLLRSGSLEWQSRVVYKGFRIKHITTTVGLVNILIIQQVSFYLPYMLPLGTIFRKFDLCFPSFADDIQIYLH